MKNKEVRKKNKDYIRFLEAENKRHINEMSKYFETELEIDKLLRGMMIKKLDVKKSYKILDACCGTGYLSLYLSRSFPNSKILGIDLTKSFIYHAKKFSNNKVKFELLDIHKISKKYKKSFDVTVMHKTLSWLPDFELAVKNMIDITKSHIFLSSLFYEGDIDFLITVKQNGKDYSYNIYSLPRFRKFCEENGAKLIEVEDFKIGIDLPKPENPNTMNTYTVRLNTGERLQISGALLMNWKLIHIEL